MVDSLENKLEHKRFNMPIRTAMNEPNRSRLRGPHM